MAFLVVFCLLRCLIELGIFLVPVFKFCMPSLKEENSKRWLTFQRISAWDIFLCLCSWCLLDSAIFSFSPFSFQSPNIVWPDQRILHGHSTLSDFSTMEYHSLGHIITLPFAKNSCVTPTPFLPPSRPYPHPPTHSTCQCSIVSNLVLTGRKKYKLLTMEHGHV